MRTKLVEVTYKPGSTLQPQGLREAAAQVGASVAQLQIVALGRIEGDGSKRYFIAGKDRFLLTDSVSIPEGKPVSITGTVDDSVMPFKLKVVEFRPMN